LKAIVTYHSIDDSGSVVSVHPDRFIEHVEIMCGKGIPIVSLDELLDPSREDGLSITFDDGFENLATVAWPVLRARGLTATVFVATEWVGKENAWDPDDSRIPKLPLLDWQGLRELAEDGLELGSHSRTHPRMPSLTDERLEEELRGSMGDIQARTGIAPVLFAYPYGDSDPRVEVATERAGYSWAVTTELRVLGRAQNARYAVPRLDAYYLAKPGVMESWGSGAFRRYVQFRRAARRLRSTLTGGFGR